MTAKGHAFLNELDIAWKEINEVVDNLQQNLQ